MSVGWIRRLRDRPIGEHERCGALAGVAVIAIATTLLLALTAPEAPQPRAASVPSRQVGDRDSSYNAKASGSSASAVLVARRFLHGYLGYIYGYGRAAQVSEATSRLARSLPNRAPMVPASMRARHPRVIALHAVTAPSGSIEVTALINDGGLVDYSLALSMTELSGRLLVAGVGGT